MTTDTTNLVQEINKLIEAGTFTAAAANGIADLRTRAAKAEATIEELGKRNVALKDTVSVQEKKIAEFKGMIDSLESREVAVATREKEMTKLEQRVAVAEATGKAFDTINQRMLANRIVREDIYHSQQVPIPTGGSYMTVSQTETKQHTVKDEQ